MGLLVFAPRGLPTGKTQVNQTSLFVLPSTANKKKKPRLIPLQGLSAGPERHDESNGKTNIFLDKMIKPEVGKAHSTLQRAAGVEGSRGSQGRFQKGKSMWPVSSGLGRVLEAKSGCALQMAGRTPGDSRASGRTVDA